MFIEGEKQIKEKKQDSNLILEYNKHCQGKIDFLHCHFN